MAIEDPAQVIAPVAQELACSPRFVIGDSVFDCALAKRFHKPTGNGSYPIKPFGEISICPYGTKKYVPVSSGHWAAGDSQSSLHSVKPLYSVPRVRTKERAIVVVNLHCGWRLEIIDRRVFVVSITVCDPHVEYKGSGAHFWQMLNAIPWQDRTQIAAIEIKIHHRKDMTARDLGARYNVSDPEWRYWQSDESSKFPANQFVEDAIGRSAWIVPLMDRGQIARHATPFLARQQLLRQRGDRGLSPLESEAFSSSSQTLAVHTCIARNPAKVRELSGMRQHVASMDNCIQRQIAKISPLR